MYQCFNISVTYFLIDQLRPILKRFCSLVKMIALWTGIFFSLVFQANMTRYLARIETDNVFYRLSVSTDFYFEI